MVIIQSSSLDRSTNDIIDWLAYYKANYIRLNDDYGVVKTNITLHNNRTFINDIDISKCSYMYRRGDLCINFELQEIDNVDKINNWLLHEKLFEENTAILDSINYLFKRRPSISHVSDIDISKIEQLEVANSVGLLVPDTLLSNDFSTIINFLNDQKCITKSLSNVKIRLSYSSDWNINMHLTTASVDSNDITKSKKGLPVLFQQYIDKKYELRIFYLKGQFFSMAIFSQQNEKTKLDYRNYDKDKTNRNVPYKLPNEIERKLDAFMKAINMNCGSIDMIYTPEGKYIFLEVNSIGQYQWLESNCNYSISKNIAEMLITMNLENERFDENKRNSTEMDR